ncbi:MAG TPA: DNA repair protein RecN [Oligoflexia bacterium]|nr:DNA repair protein RecN [Oligoflexia bacterium]HMR25700.1 DNA repair protein RecN [Oligoflexia bacterium]
MLTWIKIQDLAIISQAYVDFKTGLNVLTGETGAGKSILIDSIEFLSGKRASSLDVRHGSPYAVIEGSLQISSEGSKIWQIMEELGLPLSDNEIHLKRVISANGKSKAFVNLSPCTVGTLAELAKHWLDMTGQHSQSQLADEKNYINLLDQFCNHAQLISSYQQNFNQLKQIDHEIAMLKVQQKTFAQEKDFLEYQYSELEKAKLESGELEKIAEEEKVVKNAEQLAENIQTATELIDDNGGILDQINKLSSVMQKMKKITQDSKTQNILEQLSIVTEPLNQISLELSLLQNTLEFEPEKVESINQRLSTLQSIKRKYGSIDTAIAERDRLKELLGRHMDLEASFAELYKSKKDILKTCAQQALEIQQNRKKYGEVFADKVSNELKKLGMDQAEFHVDVIANEEGIWDEESKKFFSSNGVDQVTFMFSPNLGEGKKPLDTIASGGELSRVLLAIKSIAALEQGNEKVFLFDEVDAGIGGETAERVGIHLKQLSFSSQVLCVTHLAQVACYADHHLYIEKQAKEGRTQALVKSLSTEDQKQEIARMIGGINITPKVIEHASELLNRKNEM